MVIRPFASVKLVRGTTSELSGSCGTLCQQLQTGRIIRFQVGNRNTKSSVLGTIFLKVLPPTFISLEELWVRMPGWSSASITLSANHGQSAKSTHPRPPPPVPLPRPHRIRGLFPSFPGYHGQRIGTVQPDLCTSARHLHAAH